jgi:uncharacterized SAM-binding protein YcdF (DUF218 family)
LTFLVSYLFSSGALVFILIVAAAWLWRRPHSPNARRLLLTLAITYGALSCYAVSFATGRLLVAGYEPLAKAAVPSGQAAIVVLGSGTFTARDWDDTRFSALDRASTVRVLEAVRVFQMTNAEWVISSGGLVTPSDVDEPNGVTMRNALIRLGVPSSRVLVETKSRNTHDEAMIVKEMLAALKVQHVILVTSDLHMRRSLGAFRAQGIDALPAIARYPTPDMPWSGWILPSEGGLDLAADVWHEILGLGYYFGRGWYR